MKKYIYFTLAFISLIALMLQISNSESIMNIIITILVGIFFLIQGVLNTESHKFFFAKSKDYVSDVENYKKGKYLAYFKFMSYSFFDFLKIRKIHND